MNKKTMIFTAMAVLMCCAAVSAADYRFTYKKGKVSETKNIIKSGADSVFALSYGAAIELRCGPGSALEINSITKTGESSFTLKSGSCFVRIIDDGSGDSLSLKTPFLTLKSSSGAVYAGCAEKAVYVYDGFARIDYKGHLAKLTSGKTFNGNKITEIIPQENSFRDWAMKRDKTDLLIKLQAGVSKQADIEKYLREMLEKGYAAGKIQFNKEPEPEDMYAALKISTAGGRFSASGIISSGITGAVGAVDASREADGTGDPYVSAAFMPFIYDTANSILKAFEQSDAECLKKGRKTIIEAEDVSDADLEGIEKSVRAMPGFISVNRKNYHNTKAVFEVLQAGTGYDIEEVLAAKFQKSNISIWKYSKNIVKLRVVKVER